MKILVAAVAGLALSTASAQPDSRGDREHRRIPVAPCAGAPEPVPASVGDLLNQSVWIDEEVPAEWSPSACTGWEAGPTRVLLAAAGRLRVTGGSDELAARIANVSSMTDILYWSSTRNRWRHLFADAAALSGPRSQARREDFVAADLVTGARLHYWLEESNPTAGVVYEMLVRERTPERIVLENTNLTPLEAKLLFFSRDVAEPGEFRQISFLERETGNVWRYYTLIRLGQARSLLGTSAANYRNRVEAYFRYLAGTDMDREPPAAR